MELPEHILPAGISEDLRRTKFGRLDPGSQYLFDLRNRKKRLVEHNFILGSGPEQSIISDSDSGLSIVQARQNVSVWCQGSGGPGQKLPTGLYGGRVSRVWKPSRAA